VTGCSACALPSRQGGARRAVYGSGAAMIPLHLEDCAGARGLSRKIAGWRRYRCRGPCQSSRCCMRASRRGRKAVRGAPASQRRREAPLTGRMRRKRRHRSLPATSRCMVLSHWWSIPRPRLPKTASYAWLISSSFQFDRVRMICGQWARRFRWWRKSATPSGDALRRISNAKQVPEEIQHLTSYFRDV